MIGHMPVWGTAPPPNAFKTLIDRDPRYSMRNLLPEFASYDHKKMFAAQHLYWRRFFRFVPGGEDEWGSWEEVLGTLSRKPIKLGDSNAWCDGLRDELVEMGFPRGALTKATCYKNALRHVVLCAERDV